jgi:hypothetical protein
MICDPQRYQKHRARSSWQAGEEERIARPSSPSAFLAYSGSPIAVHGRHDAEWLFPQEKATLHTTGQCT